jgi:hypothetical protein
MTLEKREIRILQPKISDEKTDSFFYDGSIAHAIRSDGKAILLVANGVIRLEIDGKEYDNETKEKAIEIYELTDKKLADLEKEGMLIWENSNWFEVIWTKNGIGGWESVSHTLEHDYDAALRTFKDCYNRKSLNEYERRIEVTLTDADVDPEFLELLGFKRCKD